VPWCCYVTLFYAYPCLFGDAICVGQLNLAGRLGGCCILDVGCSCIDGMVEGLQAIFSPYMGETYSGFGTTSMVDVVTVYSWWRQATAGSVCGVAVCLQRRLFFLPIACLIGLGVILTIMPVAIVGAKLVVKSNISPRLAGEEAFPLLSVAGGVKCGDVTGRWEGVVSNK